MPLKTKRQQEKQKNKKQKEWKKNRQSDVPWRRAVAVLSCRRTHKLSRSTRVAHGGARGTREEPWLAWDLPNTTHTRARGWWIRNKNKQRQASKHFVCHQCAHLRLALLLRLRVSTSTNQPINQGRSAVAQRCPRQNKCNKKKRNRKRNHATKGRRAQTETSSMLWPVSVLWGSCTHPLLDYIQCRHTFDGLWRIQKHPPLHSAAGSLGILCELPCTRCFQ